MTFIYRSETIKFNNDDFTVKVTFIESGFLKLFFKTFMCVFIIKKVNK